MDSILQSIKKLLGVNPEYGYFDDELIIHINSVLMILNQLAVGEEGFQITGPNETWQEFLGEDTDILATTRSYVFLKVKLLWDPPTSSAINESFNRSINEFEWRLNVKAEEEKVGESNE